MSTNRGVTFVTIVVLSLCKLALTTAVQDFALWTTIAIFFAIVVEVFAGKASLFGDALGFVGYGNVDGDVVVLTGLDLLTVVKT